MPHILLTNDDGIHAEGLRVLAAAFAGFADVSIVAPSSEQSGKAQSLTLRQPIVGWDAGGLRDCGAAQTFDGEGGFGDFGD
jgi:5'/3'-nucleotidase SurE